MLAVEYTAPPSKKYCKLIIGRCPLIETGYYGIETSHPYLFQLTQKLNGLSNFTLPRGVV